MPETNFTREKLSFLFGVVPPPTTLILPFRMRAQYVESPNLNLRDSIPVYLLLSCHPHEALTDRFPAFSVLREDGLPVDMLSSRQ